MSASDVEDLIALIDVERIHRAQILPPSFASHDERNDSPQEAPRISSLFSDKAGTPHAQPSATGATSI